LSVRLSPLWSAVRNIDYHVMEIFPHHTSAFSSFE
jgi:hypothetical protein